MIAMAKRGSVLVFGGTGMLGHEVVRALSTTREVHLTARNPKLASAAGLPGTSHYFEARRTDPLELIDEIKPDAVINAIGIVKQLPEASVPTTSIAVNSLFPHRLNEACVACDTRLIHVSTDCVFSGTLPIGERYSRRTSPRRGRPLRKEQAPRGGGRRRGRDPPDIDHRVGARARDRVCSNGSRSRQGTTVQGFTQAIFSGLTTRELARVVGRVIDEFPDLRGLFHVASEPISKFDLLKLLRDALGLETEIEPRSEPVDQSGARRLALRAGHGHRGRELGGDERRVRRRALPAREGERCLTAAES